MLPWTAYARIQIHTYIHMFEILNKIINNRNTVHPCCWVLIKRSTVIKDGYAHLTRAGKDTEPVHSPWRVLKFETPLPEVIKLLLKQYKSML